MKAIVMMEEYWANSCFSIVRYTGRIKIEGYVYVIVNKDGKDIFECSMEAEKAGRQKAIEPGEPCDLCREEFVSLYKQLGREAFLKMITEHRDIEKPEDMKKYL